MPLGGGKYDPELEAAAATTGAHTLILIVLDGNRGTGFAVRAPLEIMARIPDLLRGVADGIAATKPGN